MTNVWRAKKTAGSLHRFDFAVTVVIISVLAVMALQSLEKFEHHVEKVIQETVLNHIRLGLTEFWLHQNVTHQTIDIKAMINSNPMRYIADKPENYIGEMPSPPANRTEIWYFDTSRKELIYVYNSGEQVKYRLESLQDKKGKKSSALLSVGGIALVAVNTQ